MTQSIQNNFWRSAWFVWTKLPGCWQLKNKNSPSKTNNHLLFNVQTAYSSARERGRERERERICKGIWRDTKRPSPSPTELSERHLLTTDRLTSFSKFANLYISKFGISVGDVILINHCVISHVSQIHCFHLSNLTFDKTAIHFVYILVFLCWSLCTHLNFPIWFTFLLT